MFKTIVCEHGHLKRQCLVCVLQAELEAAEKKNKELRGLIRAQEIQLPFDVADDMTTEFAVEIAQLKADLEAVQKDTARLNWIEFTQSGLCMVVRKYRDNPNVDSLGWQVGHRQPRITLRDAIDAAMKERKEQG